MRILFFVLLLAGYSVPAQVKDYGFYVGVNGDTVKLGEKDYVDVHSHPQLLRVRDSSGRKKVVLPSDVVFMRMISYSGNKTRVKEYTMLDIKSRKKRSGFCSHYVNNLYVGEKASIVETPYCYQCNSYELHIKADGKYIGTFSKDNFKGLVEKYFSEHTALVEYARSGKKYKAFKIETLLRKSR